MKRILLLLTFCLLLTRAENLLAWGQKGHDVIAHIAECNISKKARKNIDNVLDGQTMVYWSSWMDNIRDIPEYAFTTTWHYANVDEGETYQTMRKEPEGDVYTAITLVMNQLRNRANLPDSVEAVYLKFLIHLVGDLHCPMHAGRLSDRGGNDLKIKWFNAPTNIHSVWDSKFIESARKWSYSEWRVNIDNLSRERKKQIQMGTPLDWLNETVGICKTIYMEVVPEQNYSWKYMYDNFPILEQQLRSAGYRLAALLEQIYG